MNKKHLSVRLLSAAFLLSTPLLTLAMGDDNGQRLRTERDARRNFAREYAALDDRRRQAVDGEEEDEKETNSNVEEAAAAAHTKHLRARRDFLELALDGNIHQYNDITSKLAALSAHQDQDLQNIDDENRTSTDSSLDETDDRQSFYSSDEEEPAWLPIAPMTQQVIDAARQNLHQNHAPRHQPTSFIPLESKTTKEIAVRMTQLERMFFVNIGLQQQNPHVDFSQSQQKIIAETIFISSQLKAQLNDEQLTAIGRTLEIYRKKLAANMHQETATESTNLFNGVVNKLELIIEGDYFLAPLIEAPAATKPASNEFNLGRSLGLTDSEFELGNYYLTPTVDISTYDAPAEPVAQLKREKKAKAQLKREQRAAAIKENTVFARKQVEQRATLNTQIEEAKKKQAELRKQLADLSNAQDAAQEIKAKRSSIISEIRELSRHIRDNLAKQIARLDQETKAHTEEMGKVYTADKWQAMVAQEQKQHAKHLAAEKQADLETRSDKFRELQLKRDNHVAKVETTEAQLKDLKAKLAATTDDAIKATLASDIADAESKLERFTKQMTDAQEAMDAMLNAEERKEELAAQAQRYEIVKQKRQAAEGRRQAADKAIAAMRNGTNQSQQGTNNPANPPANNNDGNKPADADKDKKADAKDAADNKDAKWSAGKKVGVGIVAVAVVGAVASKASAIADAFSTWWNKPAKTTKPVAKKAPVKTSTATTTRTATTRKAA